MISQIPEEEYLKFLICARRKPEDTQERYFYEWGTIHLSLMTTTPEVMRVFKKYAQHYSLNNIDNESLIYPLSNMGWDNMADHWLASHEDFIVALTAEDYVVRMQPHRFGDHAFELALARGSTLFRREGYRPGGGVKLVNWLKRAPGISRAEFADRFAAEYGGAVMRSADQTLFRKYVLNVQLDLDKERFKGTLFERGDVTKFDGVEEIWFDSLDDLRRLRTDPAYYDAIRTAAGPLIDIENSFAMVTTERVAFDYATGEFDCPPPSILNPDSLEAYVARQGFEGWNVPRPPADDRSGPAPNTVAQPR